MRKTLYDMLLTVKVLFDGEGGGPAAGATGEGMAPAAGEQTGDMIQDAAGPDTAPTPEERSKAWQELIRGEYKDLYDSDMQKVAKNRVAKLKELEQKNAEQQNVLDRLAVKYGTNDVNAIAQAIDNDTAMWERAADEAGMTTEQYMQFQNLQRQNAQLIREQAEREEQMQMQARIQGRLQEAQALQQIYPGFDLRAELENPAFARLVDHDDIPLQHAYELIHLNDIKAMTAHTAAAQTEKAVTDNIRARGTRPAEAGANSHTAFTQKTDFKKMSLDEMQALNQRAMNGEHIDFINTF